MSSGLIPANLKSAIVRLEYFDVGYRMLELEPANEDAWRRIWKAFKQAAVTNTIGATALNPDRIGEDQAVRTGSVSIVISQAIKPGHGTTTSVGEHRLTDEAARFPGTSVRNSIAD